MKDFSSFSGRAVLSEAYRGGIHDEETGVQLPSSRVPTVKVLAVETYCEDISRARKAQENIGKFVNLRLAGIVKLVWVSDNHVLDLRKHGEMML